MVKHVEMSSFFNVGLANITLDCYVKRNSDVECLQGWDVTRKMDDLLNCPQMT